MTPRTIIARYYLVSGLYMLSAALIWGVNTLFLLSAGLEIFEVFLANAAFAAGSVIFEIPTGVLADTRGRRVSFLLSVSILFLTTLGYLGVAHLDGGLLAFSLVSVLMGLGFTFYSGAVEAWLVDALQHVKFDGQLDSVFARGSMVGGAAMLVGTISGGLLGQVDLMLPYLARACMLVAVFVVAFVSMHDLGFTPGASRPADMARELRRITRESVQYGWNRPAVRLLMFCSFFQWGFLSWGFYAWQPYFLELLGRNAVWVAGVVAALISLSTIAGNALVDWFGRFCGRRTTLLLWAAGFQTVAAIGVGLADSFGLAVAFLLITTGAMGVTGPVKQAYLHQVIPSGQRASVISLVSLLGSAGGVLGQSTLGYLSRVRSIADGYVVGGLATVVVVPLLLLLRGRGERADVIVGRKVGRRSSCAADGIPEIGQVSAKRG
jgi:MFS family permease